MFIHICYVYIYKCSLWNGVGKLKKGANEEDPVVCAEKKGRKANSKEICDWIKGKLKVKNERAQYPEAQPPLNEEKKIN